MKLSDFMDMLSTLSQSLIMVGFYVNVLLDQLIFTQNSEPQYLSSGPLAILRN